MAGEKTASENLQEVYFCIDQKSFYASCECVERGLDPMTALLVVADAERSQNTISLAVSVAAKKKGVKNRCRLGEVPPNLGAIIAPPRQDFSELLKVLNSLGKFGFSK